MSIVLIGKQRSQQNLDLQVKELSLDGNKKNNKLHIAMALLHIQKEYDPVKRVKRSHEDTTVLFIYILIIILPRCPDACE
jgi:hypothetical protein